MLELVLLLAVTLSDDDEAGLARAIRAGDRTAFRTFFEAHHQALLRYLVHKQVAPDVAEDLVQNAFVYIWEQRHQIRDDGSLRGLLFRIGYTRALNHFRDTARLTGDLPDEAAPEADPGERMDVQEQVARAVARLPERRRAVFELCVLQGLTYREAAEALEITPKTVENHMGYALKAVREELKELRP
ncbi:MAG: sigma-70 family RNA polymerase sigma factor [Rhodothermales bacterium]|nr:sigma-70 family RNA polymerase sigma factor [Rhodothermales bacterium]MBO6781259.1 sigma-70 family RNA polymerase sigma factor [Rhodothermales bacterium]